MEVVRTDVDGVPTFWTESDAEGDGGYTVALMFRVGRADESLARSGISHLVEHLALHRVGQPEHHYNGSVDSVRTVFFTHGDADEVTGFLSTVCDSLRALPLDRLDAERQILRTEADGHSSGIVGQLLLWRYGAATYGLPGYAELGLSAHTADDVQAWTGRWFTRGNAALAISGGPPPAALRLDLPDGARMPVPVPTSALPRTPAYFGADVNGVALSGVVPRSTTANVFATILQRRLHKALRREEALSYTTEATYTPRDGAYAHILAFADGLSESHPRLAPEFIAEIERIADEVVEPAELAEAVSIHRQGMERRGVGGSLVASACWNELLGAEQRTMDGLRRELDAVSQEAIREVACAVRDSALLMLPQDVAPPAGRFSRAPGSSATAVDGTVFDDPAEPRMHLITAPTGVTLMAGPTLATVRYESCAAALAWPDGARLLIGDDGISVKVEPNRWQSGYWLAAEIDRWLTPEQVVPMPPRSAEQIPAPSPPGPARTPVQPKRRSIEVAYDLAHAAYGRLHGIRESRAWEDAELAAALPEVKRGRLAGGLGLLAASRHLPEVRSLRLGQLAEAAGERTAELATLAAERPNDPDVLLWLGAARIREAWAVRSRARAQYVSEERFARFWALLSRAGEPLMRAAALLPDDPTPWDHLQWHGLGLQHDRSEMDRIWDELHRRNPSCFAGHYSRAQVLCEKWKGSPGELVAFADATVQAAKPGDPVVAILPAAHIELATDRDDGVRAHFADPAIHAALVRADDLWSQEPVEHPRTPEAHHLFGAAFYYGGDTGRAKHHLAQVGKGMPDRMPWGYSVFPAREYRTARKELGLR